MHFKTQGKCVGCKEKYAPAKGKTHLLKCTDALRFLRSQAKLEEGYLVRVSWSEQPNMYWMLVAVPKSLTLGDLDQFLRNAWLECCGHLSEFTISGRRYMSHTESGNLSQSMKKQVGQVFAPDLDFEYLYDMGSSTELILQALETIEACPQKKVIVLMQNDPPPFSCEICKKQAQIICSLCGETTCSRCSKRHSCAEQEENTYMLMPLVNSPRTGVCGYEGKT